MTIRQLLDMALAYQGMTKSDLAARLGWSKQLLQKRINTAKFSIEDWENVAEAIGAKFEINFIFPDGRKVGL